MNLGICQRCRNKSELHEGTDGRGYCEDCLAKNAMLDPMSRHASGVEGAKTEWKANNPHFKDQKEEYLEFIIRNASDDWIDKFLKEWMKEMRRSYAWVTELRKVDDPMKLLRMAAELGYGKTTYKPVEEPLIFIEDLEEPIEPAGRTDTKVTPRAKNKKG